MYSLLPGIVQQHCTLEFSSCASRPQDGQQKFVMVSFSSNPKNDVPAAECCIRDKNRMGINTTANDIGAGTHLNDNTMAEKCALLTDLN